jgi:Sec-independent protein translocase protein TatA
MFIEGISFGSLLLLGTLAVFILGSKRAKELGKDLIGTFQEVRQTVQSGSLAPVNNDDDDEDHHRPSSS